MTANLARDLEELIPDTSSIEAVVILGVVGGGGATPEQLIPEWDRQPRGKLLTWRDARPWLDYEFDRTYGLGYCNDVRVWTKDHVYFVQEYDGLAWIDKIDRHPPSTIVDETGERISAPPAEEMTRRAMRHIWGSKD